MPTAFQPPQAVGSTPSMSMPNRQAMRSLLEIAARSSPHKAGNSTATSAVWTSGSA
jgi:hypothetical protein